MNNLELARREYFAKAEYGDGGVCPCCDRFGKVYHRKLNRGMARSLIWLWQQPREFIEVPAVAPRHVLRSSEISKLVFWGLVEEMPAPDDPARKTSGQWRITRAGVAFVEDRETAQSHIKLYNKVFLGFSGLRITISDALGKPFNYRDLMDDKT